MRYRAIKLYANASKVVLLTSLLLFPEWRKQIPAKLPPERSPRSAKRIPRIIWQTNYTSRVPAQMYFCFLFNRFLANTYEYRFCDDDDCDLFVKENYPGEIWRAFKRLRVGAARADFWRILVLLKHGGIYMDIDANLTDNPDNFIGDDADQVFITMKDGAVTNYFIASAPGNPILIELCERIVHNINNRTATNVYSLTGPAVLEAIVKERSVACLYYKRACIQGQFTSKKGQYIDKLNGAWTTAQTIQPIVADE
jgi:mannosyltransferase OCH1-like enzyme